ncbi:MAG: DMT family transporter [Patescibacteria group bacterium]
MLLWFVLALGSAVSNSAVQAIQKWAVASSRYSKFTIGLAVHLLAGFILLIATYFFLGVPVLQEGFWFAAVVTSILNVLAFPIMLRAYELGEFSAVYSMILLTPAFLLVTSFLFLGEIPSLMGLVGVLLTILGLWVVSRSNYIHSAVPDFAKGNWLGIIVALIYSITVNFDKLAASRSSAFFAPAVELLIMSVGFAVYLLLRHKKLVVCLPHAEATVNGQTVRAVPKAFILLLLGVVMAGALILHNAALLTGLASYTIAIKRVGVLLGVIWGWLFFKEKYLGKKLLGSAIAIVGVVIILWS